MCFCELFWYDCLLSSIWSLQYLLLLLLLLLLFLLLLLLLLLLLFLLFTLPQSRTYTPATYNPNARGSDACRGSNSFLVQNTRQIHKGGPPWMCGQHNVRATAEDNTGQNTDKGYTPNPRAEIKIPDPAGNRTRAVGLEGRDSTDHATATDVYNTCYFYISHKTIFHKRKVTGQILLLVTVHKHDVTL